MCCHTGILPQHANTAEYVGHNGLAVENISWITAPSGNYKISVNNYGCTPGMDYKLYVQIDGQYIVYEKVASSVKDTVLAVSFNNPRVGLESER